MRRAEDARELLDGPVPEADLDASLADLHRLNAWFGGYALTLARVRRLASARGGRPLLVADVGGGRGDFAARLVRWARRRRRPVRVVVVDRDAATARLATHRRGTYPEILAVRADATALPFRDAGVDLATSSLTLHHLEPDAAVRTLAEMRRVAARGVVVNDLLRSRLSLALVWLATRALRLHPMSRHDGPVSVRRSYTPTELAALAERAGLRGLAVARYPWLARLVLEAT